MYVALFQLAKVEILFRKKVKTVTLYIFSIYSTALFKNFISLKFLMKLKTSFALLFTNKKLTVT